MPSPAPPSPAPSPAPGQLRRRWILPARRNPHDAEILRLAVPAFGALIAEPLFLFADSVIVGRLGTAPLGGLGVASQALTTLVGISIFLAYGTTAAVARQIGAGHREAAIRQGIDGLWLAGIIGAVVLAAGWPLAPQIVHAFGGSPGVSAEAAIYLRISLLGAPSMLVVLAGTGVLRGLQDTRTPLTVAVAANVVNVALNAFLVLGLHWGIAGLGLGHGVRADRRCRRVPGHGGPGCPARRGGIRPRSHRPAGRGRHRGVPDRAHDRAAGGADRGHRGRRPAGQRGHRRAPDRVPGLDPARLRARRDRDRGPGHHRPVPRGRGRGRAPGPPRTG